MRGVYQKFKQKSNSIDLTLRSSPISKDLKIVILPAV